MSHLIDYIPGLPGSDPEISGAFWSNDGVLSYSTGAVPEIRYVQDIYGNGEWELVFKSVEEFDIV